MGFHQKLYVTLWRNLFSENLVNKYISKYIQTEVKGGKSQPHSAVELQETTKFYFNSTLFYFNVIPYVGHFTVTAQSEKCTQTR